MINNKKGFTFVELTIAAGMLGLAVVAFVGTNNFFSKKNKNIQETAIVTNYVNGLYNSIQSNLSLYQITYDSKKFISSTSPKDLQEILPLAWNADVITLKENCKECPGRMGFIIEPVNGYRGLYKLTVRVTHPKIVGFTDYSMLLVGK